MDKFLIFLFMTPKDLREYNIVSSKLNESYQKQQVIINQKNNNYYDKLKSNKITLSELIKERDQMGEKWKQLNKLIISNGKKIYVQEKLILNELKTYKNNLKLNSLKGIRKEYFIQRYKGVFVWQSVLTTQFVFAYFKFCLDILPQSPLAFSVTQLKLSKSLRFFFVALFIFSLLSIPFFVKLARFIKNNKKRNKLILLYCDLFFKEYQKNKKIN